MKLIPGQKNALYIVCKPGYAEGVNKPKRVKPAVTKAIEIKVRRNEPLVA